MKSSQSYLKNRREFVGMTAGALVTYRPIGSQHAFASAIGSSTKRLRIGLIADAQYANVDAKGTRFYRQSIDKLEYAIAQFNEQPLDFCVHLGDLIDRDWESFDPMLSILHGSKHPFYHVLGNHDFDLQDDYKSQVPSKIKMPDRFYSVSQNEWRFLFLDTNDVSLYGPLKTSPKYDEAKQRLQQLKEERKPQAQDWNGAIGSPQLEWIENECRIAKTMQQRVIVFAHHPIAPDNAHNLWNDQQLLQTLDRSPHIVAWINGHNHAGNYADPSGVPCVTLKGMVETKETSAFSIMTLGSDDLDIQGFGREISRRITLRTRNS